MIKFATEKKKERSKDIINKYDFVCVFANFQDKVFSNDPAFWQKEIKNVRQRNFSKLILQNFAVEANQQEFKWAPGAEGAEGSLTWKS